MRDRRRQLRAPLCRFGLHAEYHHFAGRIAEELERDHEIRESQLMHRRFSRQALKGVSFEAKKRSGRFADVDSVDHEKPPDAGDVVEQTEALRAAVEENDAGRDARIERETLYGVNADAIVGVNEIAEPQHKSFPHIRFRILSAAC